MARNSTSFAGACPQPPARAAERIAACARRWLATVPAAALAAVLLGSAAAAAPLTSEEAGRLLQRADDLKSADYPQFVAILASIDGQQAQLSPTQQQYLRYLRGWQSAWEGDYEKAIPALKAVVANSHNVTLQFRAGVSVVNVLALATRYEDALTQLQQLLQLLPRVSDRTAREQGLGAAPATADKSRSKRSTRADA
jgi:tetratricopeptide (TPR) repeat protein